MGPINWMAVVLGAMVAAGVAWPYYRLLGRQMPHAARLLALIVPALMVGHNFARVADLALKPKLYWMMSGGLALAIIIPAQIVSDGRRGVAWRETMVDAGYWVVSFMAMGTVFWALR